MLSMIILKKIHVARNSFAPSFFNHFSLSLKRKKRVVMRATRKKLNIFTLQLSIYYKLEQEISISANGKNGAREIDCLCCREVDAMLIALAKILEREGITFPSSFYGQLSDYQSHVLDFSTQQTSSSFSSQCS